MTDRQPKHGPNDPSPSIGMTLERAFGGPFKRRDPEVYGPVRLSVQAGATNYSAPKAWLDDLREYECVEVGFLLDGKGLTYPSKAGIEGFDHLFEQGMNSPVAGYVSLADVEALRAAVVAKHGGASE